MSLFTKKEESGDERLVRPGKTFKLENGEEFTFQFEPPAWLSCNPEDENNGISQALFRTIDQEIVALAGMLENFDKLGSKFNMTRIYLMWHLYRRLDAYLQYDAWAMKDGEEDISSSLLTINHYDDECKNGRMRPNNPGADIAAKLLSDLSGSL